MSETFLGASEETLELAGKVVIAAARIEAVAHEIASALNADTTTFMMARTIKAILRALAETPWCPWMTCSAEDVSVWCRDVQEAMDRRNVLVHSTYARLRMNDADLGVHLDRRKGVTDAGDNDMEDLAEGLVALVDRGHGLVWQLTPEMRPGLSVQVLGPLRGRATYRIVNGTFPTAPTTEEFERWRQRFLAWVTDPELRTAQPPPQA